MPEVTIKRTLLRSSARRVESVLQSTRMPGDPSAVACVYGHWWTLWRVKAHVRQ